MKNLAKFNQVIIGVNILIVIVSVISFFVILNQNLYVIAGVMALITLILDVVALILNRKNGCKSMGYVLISIGVLLFLLFGPTLGLIAPVLIIFGIIFNKKQLSL